MLLQLLLNRAHTYIKGISIGSQKASQNGFKGFSFKGLLPVVYYKAKSYADYFGESKYLSTTELSPWINLFSA